jgi:hypothetical protein
MEFITFFLIVSLFGSNAMTLFILTREMWKKNE